MANMPDRNNVQRGLRTPRTLDMKVRKGFQRDGMTLKDAYILALEFATRNIPLEPADHIQIAQEMEEDAHGQKSAQRVQSVRRSMVREAKEKSNGRNNNLKGARR